MALRILIAEDEEPLTLLLRYNLEAEGYAVDSVARGDEAELRLREAVPDLVLLDWMLPGLSGIELCRRIRLRRETERLPVIMLTARGEEGDRVRGLATGADDYITKPFSVPELLARVRTLLRRTKPAHVAQSRRRRHRARPRDAPGAPRRPRASSRPDRVQAARVPDAEPGPGVLARPASRRRLGPRRLCRRAHRRRACRPAAQGDQSCPPPRSDPDRARRRLLLRRDLQGRIADVGRASKA